MILEVHARLSRAWWCLGVEVTPEGLARFFEVVLPHLDERQRRVVAGAATEVEMHDFPDPTLGEHAKAIHYGIYDLANKEGWVSVGDTSDTAGFAVESIRRWWNTMGQDRFPNTNRLLICADAGGSNGCRVRAWKRYLTELAAETGLDITVCHYPPGTSKWNRIEHRMFSFITMNWRGRPLTSIRTIVELIFNITTQPGLRVQTAYDPTWYPLEVHHHRTTKPGVNPRLRPPTS